MQSSVDEKTSASLDATMETLLALYADNDREILSPAVLDRLRASPMIRLLDESSEKGPGTLKAVLNTCRQLGKIDAALSWVVGVSNSAWSVKSCFNLSASMTSVIEDNAMLAMVLGRPGVLKKAKQSGDYLLSGQWWYVSGWQYSSCFFCLATLETAQGSLIHMVPVPAHELERAGEWRATGLRATQSVSVTADDIVIPAEHLLPYQNLLSGSLEKNQPSTGKATYSGLFTGVLMNCLLGAVIGATEAGFAYVVQAMKKRPVAGSRYTHMSDSGALRTEIGRLRSQLDMVIHMAECNAHIVDVVAADPEQTLSIGQRVENRARATKIMRICVDIVQDLLWVYGSGGLESGSTLERIWRDVNVGARHGGFTKCIPEEALGLLCLGENPMALTRML